MNQWNKSIVGEEDWWNIRRKLIKNYDEYIHYCREVWKTRFKNIEHLLSGNSAIDIGFRGNTVFFENKYPKMVVLDPMADKMIKLYPIPENIEVVKSKLEEFETREKFDVCF